MSKQIFIIGTPRSGTTWVFDVLANGPNATGVLEPDNEKVSFLGKFFKGHLPRFPTLQPGEEDPHYHSIWQHAMHSPIGSWLATNRLLRSLEGIVFSGERLVVKKERLAWEKFEKDPRRNALREPGGIFATPVQRNSEHRRVVKSVHGVFALEWIAHKMRPDHVLLVQRMPHGILASLKKLVMADGFRLGSLASHLTEAECAEFKSATSNPDQFFAASVEQLAMMYAWLDELLSRHPDWVSVHHEELCEDPVARYRTLFERLGLEFTAKIEATIRERDRPGEGFATVRKASDQIGKWRKSLTAAEISLIDDAFAKRGLTHWTAAATVK